MEDLSHIIGRLPIGVWVAEVPSGKVAYVNEAFRVIMGQGATASSEITDAPQTYGICDRAGNPYPVERLPFSRVVTTGEPAVVDDIVIHRPDQKKVNVRALAHPVRSDSGTFTHVSISFIDITREVLAEDERDRAAERLAMAVNHAPIVIWSTDLSGRITLSQGAGLAALGLQSGDLEGKNIFELYGDHPTISCVRRVLQGESLQYLSEIGDAVLDTYSAPLRDAEGRVVGMMGLSRDVRELQQLQAVAIQNDRSAALGTLAASVAHEINNPLTYILGHAEQIEDTLSDLARLTQALEDSAPAAEVRRLLGSLRADVATLRFGTERIASITRELRTFSHSDDKHRQAVDVREVVRSVLRLVGKELEAGADVVLELGETAAVSAHPSRLMQVVLNLVTNAMQSLVCVQGRRNEIRIRTETRSGNVVIEVADSGPGVPASKRERIFEPFVTSKPVGEGTGLGLFVCRNIARSYGGDVSVDDSPLGGASFRVHLPVVAVDGAARVSAAPEPAPVPAPKAHILIIDDDPRVSATLCSALRRAGYHASSCASGAAGLERLLQVTNVDLVYCDLMMKGMTGMDLHAELARQAPHQLGKVVFITGGAYSPNAQEFVLAHPDRIVEKPFDLLGETRRRLAGLSL